MLFAQTWRNFQKAIHYVQKSRPKSSCLDKSRLVGWIQWVDATLRRSHLQGLNKPKIVCEPWFKRNTILARVLIEYTGTDRFSRRKYCRINRLDGVASTP